MNQERLEQYIKEKFSIDPTTFIEALNLSPSAQGYIIGATSEIILKNYLEEKGYEVRRIVEKPKGGFDEKNPKARGDFYARKPGREEDWFVVECKGLKTNAEFQNHSLLSRDGVYRYLKRRVFKEDNFKEKKYKKGLKKYEKLKEEWEANNNGKFPEFGWNPETPGPETFTLVDLWESEEGLKEWLDQFSEEDFTEEAYRNVEGPVAILETHMPSTRTSKKTGKKQAAPIVGEFTILAVNLFERTGEHNFVFANPTEMSHSSSSPVHLYQNYTIDVLVKEKKEELTTQPPWYSDIDELVKVTNPIRRELDHSQLDRR